ncbi:MAG: hypothetical protein O7I93_03695 [Gemmatimonadetes bacterium]|nr:hypothetical protein [Gemmatimonadota bacterium]
MKALRWVSVGILFALVACNSTPTIEVTGQWLWSSTFTSTSPAVTCTTSGSLLLSSGTQFTGIRSNIEAECAGGPAGLEDQLKISANVVNANINGNVVTMEIDFCQHEGTVTLDTPSGDVMSGTHECPVGLVGAPQFFTGTWEASR